ncbi:hypothetical protein FRC11_000149 [Ceratobasidium sp. 423]|nr:hypothetical protein FRC11_000149 [Ceratobasidium sp. 423]
MNLWTHTKVLDDSRLRIQKVAGVGGAMVASSRLGVDMTLQAPRLGERHELIIELELDNPDGIGICQDLPPDAALGEGTIGAIIDEASVFDVDGGFFDPGAGKTVARPGHPVIMRAIVPVGRRDYNHAIQLLVGTRTALTNILKTSLPPPTSRTTRKELVTLAAVGVIQSTVSDVSVRIDTLEGNPEGITNLGYSRWPNIVHKPIPPDKDI